MPKRKRKPKLTREQLQDAFKRDFTRRWDAAIAREKAFFKMCADVVKKSEDQPWPDVLRLNG